jgi:hypothetical protein
MLVTVTDLIYGALTEIRVARGGDVVRAEDQALCLNLLNEVIERLPVTPNALYAVQAVALTLVPGQAAYTIGPTGQCDMPRRPVRIRRAWMSVAPGSSVNRSIPLQSEAWLLGQTLPSLMSPYPEGLWYNPTWPLGALYFWPLASLVNIVSLETELEIVAVADTDSLDLPQGYSELLRLWTAKKAAPSFAREFSAASQAALTECLADVFGSNIGRVNDADTRDGGVPGGRGGTYDYRTGQVT